MKINGVVESKLRFLEQVLDDLKNWPFPDLETFQRNAMLRRATERALQLAVESMIDVSERILASQRIPPADSAAENMRQLENLKILNESEKYIEMVRFRNFIVHRYEQIDPEVIFSIVKGKLKSFRDFIDEVRKACAAK